MTNYFRIFGFFDLTIPMYMIRDPEIVKKVTIKDFDYFMDHRSLLADAVENSDSLFASTLVSLTGQKWREMRMTLSPAFTGSKMRLMFGLVSEVAANMSKYYLKESENGPVELEMKKTFSRFTNDVIASAAFGIKVDSFNDEDNQFFKMGQKMMDFSNWKTLVKIFAFRAFPKLMDRMGFDVLDADLNRYFKEMITNTMNQREAEGITRPDMINILMQLRKGQLSHNEKEEATLAEGFATAKDDELGKSTRKWTDNELIAQALIFFLAGFETTATCLQFLANEIMVNEDVQQKLYEEIVETQECLPNGRLTYEILQGMKYLDAVVCEVLRFWSPAPLTERICVKDYQFDDGHGCKFTIEKGCGIWIPVRCFHHDPKYFPEPEKFDPERFSDENKANIPAGVYMPFGNGPRNCIGNLYRLEFHDDALYNFSFAGSRFALMEVKTVVYHLLLNFSFEKTEKTQIPLKLAKGGLSLKTEKGVWLELKPRI
jgi:cytochrome P450 family 9